MANDKVLTLDMSGLVQVTQDMAQELQQKLETIAQQLALQSEAHMRELASQKLHSRLEMFNENLHFEQLDKGVFAVVLEEKAVFIDEGQEPHSMIEDLLSSPKAKMGKNGKYLVVPFRHDKGPTKQTKKQAVLLKTIKQMLSEQKIPYKKIEKDPSGNPKLGLLHKLSFTSPEQQHKLPRGQQGPQGMPFRTNTLGTGEQGAEGRPYLWDVRIYQKVKKNPDGSVVKGSDGQPSIDRGIFTFRTVSAKSTGWNHPGIAPTNIFEETYQWAKEKWENEIVPELIQGLGKS